MGIRRQLDLSLARGLATPVVGGGSGGHCLINYLMTLFPVNMQLLCRIIQYVTTTIIICLFSLICVFWMFYN